MSEEISKDDIIPAQLEPGEALISAEMAEKYEKFVEEQTAKIEETKPVLVEEAKDDGVIKSAIPKESKPAKPAIAEVNGAIGSSAANKKDKVAPKKESKTEKVAVYSTRNVTWSGVGKVYRGYNILLKDEAEQWLKRDHIRLATPEEVAKEFGK